MQTPKGRQTVQMNIALPPAIYADIRKMAEIKSEEHGEKISISGIGCRVMTRWVEKQRRKYGDMLATEE